MIDLMAGPLIDAYCERQVDGLWAEPLNVVSNLGFIIAAVMVGVRLSKQSLWRVADLWLLTGLLAAIGLGSSLWHLTARSWALQFDIWPITLFINGFLVVFLWRVARLRWRGVAALLLVFQLASYGTLTLAPPGFLNGSVFYLPAWLALGLVCLWLGWRRHRLYSMYLGVLLVFSLSLAARTVDQSVCSLVPVGTHFVWHLLNAWVLYRLLVGVIPWTQDESL